MKSAGDQTRTGSPVNASETIISGESLVDEAKGTLRLADTIVESLLHNGLSIHLGELKSSLMHEQPGSIRLQGAVSISPTDDLFRAISQIAQEKEGRLSEVSLYRHEVPFYSSATGPGLYTLETVPSLSNVLVNGILIQFPDTSEARDALWYVREALTKVHVAIDFLGDGELLARCRLRFWSILFPGIEQGEENQKVTPYSISDSIRSGITSVPAYFTSDSEFREYKEWDEKVVAYYKAALEEWEKKGAPQGGLPEAPQDVREATRRRDLLFSQAWDRWLRDKPPLFRVKSKTSQDHQNETEDWNRLPSDRTVLDRILRRHDIHSPLLLVVKNPVNLPLYAISHGSNIVLSFTIGQHALTRVKKTTARVILVEERPDNNVSASAFASSWHGCRDESAPPNKSR